MNAEHVEAALKEIRDEEDLGARTYNHYPQAIDEFGKWLASSRRLAFNPVAGISRLNAETDVRHKRRCAVKRDCLAKASYEESRITIYSTQEFTMETIPVEELQQRLSSTPDLLVVDVRTPVEFNVGHIPQARNIPLTELSPERLQQEGLAGKPIALVCQGGGRAKNGCELLDRAGIPGVINVAGGTKAWINAGFPVVQKPIDGASPASLDRQVRIVAGGLVVLASFAALALSPWFALISLGVGGGLVFAGVTNTCGMALLLAEAPWNKPRNMNNSGASGVSPSSVPQ